MGIYTAKFYGAGIAKLFPRLAGIALRSGARLRRLALHFRIPICREPVGRTIHEELQSRVRIKISVGKNCSYETAAAAAAHVYARCNFYVAHFEVSWPAPAASFLREIRNVT